MTEEKPRPKLDARGRASVFHFEDGWIKRQPVDCREIVQAGQGAAEPSRAAYSAWWNRLSPSERASAVLWAEDAGPAPMWLRDVVMPQPNAAETAPPAGVVAPPPADAPPVFADEADKDPAPAKPKK